MRLQWDEPWSYRRCVSRNAPSKLKAVVSAAVTLAALWTGAMFAVGHQVNGSWFDTILVAAMMAAVIAGSLQFVFSISPAVDFITEDGVGWNAMCGASVQVARWHWTSIASCDIRTVTAGGRTYSALHVETIDHLQADMVLAANVTPAQVAEVVHANFRPPSTRLAEAPQDPATWPPPPKQK